MFLHQLQLLVLLVLHTPVVVVSSRIEECYRQFGDLDYNPHPDMELTVAQVIWKYGYPVETHTVLTADDYVLTLYRIPPRAGNGNATVVFLAHGLFANAHIWLLQHGIRNLAFKLAEEGFDVWLGNFRGSRYSQKHEKLSPEDSRFWKFTFHEIGVYDLPAIFQYVLIVTGKPKLHYVGHSMAATILFAGLSELPELNEVVASAVLYAPAVFLSNTKSIAGYLAPVAEEVYVMTSNKLRGRFNGLDLLEERLGQRLSEYCSYTKIACDVCSEINAKLFGHDPLQMNYTLLPLLFSIVPDSVSTRTILHYAQLIMTGKFRKFDYISEAENEKRYGQVEPPDYDLSGISVPLYFFWGENDRLVTPMDVNVTASQIRRGILKESTRVDWPFWTHRDFIKGNDADSLVYTPTIRILNNYR